MGSADRGIERGLRSVDWPARLQRLTHGPLIELAPDGAEIWLDGGHNPHCAAAVATAIADLEERGERALYLVTGMLRTKDAFGFFGPFRGLARHVATVDIPGRGDEPRRDGESFTSRPRRRPRCSTGRGRRRRDATDRRLGTYIPRSPPPRILICGSLYLAGEVLGENS